MKIKTLLKLIKIKKKNTMEKKVKTTEQIVNEFINDKFESFKTHIIEAYEEEKEYYAIPEEKREEEFGELSTQITRANYFCLSFLDFQCLMSDIKDFFERQKRNEIIYNNRFEIKEKLTQLIRGFETDDLSFSSIGIDIKENLYLDYIFFGYYLEIYNIDIKKDLIII